MRVFGSLLLSLLVFFANPVSSGERVARVVTAAPSGTPWVGYLEAIRAALDKPTPGRLPLDIFPSSLLGGELHAIQELRRGRVEMGLFTTASLASVTPSLKVLDLPYLWASAGEADYVLDHTAIAAFRPLLERRGIVLIAFNQSGSYHLAARRPLMLPTAAKGLRPRAMQAGISLSFWRALNANPIALAYPDVLPSLQTGLIDGVAIELQSIYYGEYYRFVPHVTLTGHALEVGALVASKAWIDRLDPAQQRNLFAAAGRNLARSRAETRALEATLIAKLRASDAHVHDLLPAQQEVWRHYLADFRPKVLQTFDDEGRAIYARITQAQADFSRHMAGGTP